MSTGYETAEKDATATPVPAFARHGGAVRRRLQSYPWLPGLVGAGVMIGVGEALSPGFASWHNINQILAAAAILAIASCGQTLVMIAGDFGIDLSVGEVMSLTAIVGYMVLNGGSKMLPVAVVAVLVIGGAVGVINGVLNAIVRLPALVVTLGTLVVAQGVVQALASNGTPAGSVPNLLLELTTGGVGGISYVTFVGAAFVVGMVLAVRRSRYGRMLFLVGSNRAAARLSGLPVRSVVIATFVIAGMCSGFAGLLLLSYAGAANLDLGSDYLLLSIAATVIGGTSLAGGEGSLVGAATGAIAFITIDQVMSVVGASDAVREMVVGGILMALLAVNGRIPKLRQ